MRRLCATSPNEVFSASQIARAQRCSTRAESSDRFGPPAPKYLDTPRLVADATGTTVWKWDQQEPFGDSVPDENPSGLGTFDLPLRLPGQHYDKETQLHYNARRDYDPSVGRYAESDPIGLRARVNTYAYVDGDPIALTDRTGLKAICYDGVGIRCHSNELPPTEKLPTPLPNDPRIPPMRQKPGVEFCANTQFVLANCQQCCTRIAQIFRDAGYVSPCNVACNDKFACKANPHIASNLLGVPLDILLAL